MYVHKETPKGNKSRAVANFVVQKKGNGKQGLGFVDNRMIVEKQQKLQMMINHGAERVNGAGMQTSRRGLKELSNSKINVMQLFRVGYQPDHTNLIVPNHHIGAYDRETFDRPTGWYDGTFDELWRRGITRINPWSMNFELRCPNTWQWVTASGCDIGHIQNWEPYVFNTNPANTREARWAYNDLNNLQLEERLGNSSHDWERDDFGNFKDEPDDMEGFEGKNLDEYDLSDSFIDDSSFSAHDTEMAFQDMRDNVLPKFKSVGFLDKLQREDY